MILTVEDLLDMQSYIGYGCTVGVSLDLKGFSLRAWITDESGEDHLWKKSFSFAEAQYVKDQTMLTDTFCSEAKLFFWNQNIGAPEKNL